jgi:hypothetical protein
VKELQDPRMLVRLVTRLAPDPEGVGVWIESLRADNPRLNKASLAELACRKVVRGSALQGALLGLPGAVPGLGTAFEVTASLANAAADVTLLIRSQVLAVFALGAIYGVAEREILIQDTLICIGLWTKAISTTKAGSIRIGAKILDLNFRKRFPARVLQQINRKVGRTILTKYGTKRGAVAIGRIIPFGVGVLVGGGFNYAAMTAFTRRAIAYFAGKTP